MDAADIYKPRVSPRKTVRLLRDTDYAVWEWGDEGSPLLFYLHGWGDCATTWQPVVDSLSGNWRVIAPDWRGFGETRCRATSYWFPDYLADLDALLDACSDGPVRLVGHSMGGNVGGLYAGARPERVRAFVSIEGFGLPDAPAENAPGRYREWLDRLQAPGPFASYAGFEELAARIRKRNPQTPAPLAEYFARCWAREAGGRVRLKADPLHRLPNPVLYRRAESEACWRRIAAEVLLVTGARSPFAGQAEALPLPHARSVEIPGSGHMLHFEAPAELAAAIEDFLAQTL